jgi:phage shock protein PspC (stress-responsive transcriptional regulator)
MRGVLAAIGVVNATAEEAQAQSAGGFYERKPARGPLTQIREGAMISGVCNGLAVNFGFDVTLLRVIFVILAIVTSGAFVLAYAAMMFLIPYDTDVEKINDQSIPGFMFKLVTHTKRKLAGTS